MNSKVIIPILIYILFLIIAITIILGIFHFKWFTIDRGNTYKKITENIKKYDETKEFTDFTAKEDSKQDIAKQSKKNKSTLTDANKKPDKDFAEEKSETIIIKKNISLVKDKSSTTVVKYAKGSSLPDAGFDAQGEYISEEEYNYRLSLIQNLSIKSIVVDKLSKGNGISQEFFKTAYKEKMIPAKILEQLVESKEFRELIPSKYRSSEDKLATLKNGEKVVFNNTNIRDLLILWSLGRLTPIQTAWKVKAEK